MEFYDFDQDHSIDDELIHPNQQIDKDLKQKAFSWCHDFLGGIWTRATYEQFKIRYLEGGLTNYLYVCELCGDIVCDDDEEDLTTPRKVLLRIYGEIVEHHTKFNEGIIFNVMSERKMGPKLLGAFPAGRLEQFIPTRNFSVDDLRNGKNIQSLGQIIASYHMIEMPLNRNPTAFLKKIPKWLEYLEKHISECDSSFNDTELGQYLQIFKNMNISKEVGWLKNMLKNVNSPVVFCHNDFHEGNIMFTEDQNVSSQKLCLIDYEYSCYNYRGYDLGNHFNEYIYNNFCNSPDGFTYDNEKYPSFDMQMKFAQAYLQSCDNLTKDKSNRFRQHLLVSPEQLIDESNRYALASHLYWGLWGFVQHKISKIQWGYLVIFYVLLVE